MSSSKALLAVGAFAASESIGVTNVSSLGPDGGNDDVWTGGGAPILNLPGREPVDLPDIEMPDISLPDQAGTDDRGAGLEQLGEALGQAFETVETVATDPGGTVRDELEPDWVQDARDAVEDPAGTVSDAADTADDQSTGEKLGRQGGNALYGFMAGATMPLAENLESVLPYAEGDGTDTLTAIGSDLESALPYAEGDAGDTIEAIKDDTIGKVDPGSKTNEGPLTPDKSPSEAVDDVKDSISDKADSATDTSTYTDPWTQSSTLDSAKDAASNVPQGVETAMKRGSTTTGMPSVDDAITSTGLETNYSWDGPTASDVGSAASDAGSWAKDNLDTGLIL